jgi:hypothetical protein
MLLRSPAASYSTGDSTAWMATLTLTIGRLGQAFRHGLIQYLVQLPIDLLGNFFLLRRHRCFALRQGGLLPGQGFSRLIERLGFAIDFSLFGVQALDLSFQGGFTSAVFLRLRTGMQCLAVCLDDRAATFQRGLAAGQSALARGQACLLACKRTLFPGKLALCLRSVTERCVNCFGLLDQSRITNHISLVAVSEPQHRLIFLLHALHIRQVFIAAVDDDGVAIEQSDPATCVCRRIDVHIARFETEVMHGGRSWGRSRCIGWSRRSR